MPSGVGVEQEGAGPGEADILTGGDVGRAANDFQFRAVAGVNQAQRQGVGVGVWSGGAHVANHAIIPAAPGDDIAHLDAGHRQPMGHLIGWQRDVNVFGKPGEGD